MILEYLGGLGAARGQSGGGKKDRGRARHPTPGFYTPVNAQRIAIGKDNGTSGKCIMYISVPWDDLIVLIIFISA